MAVQPWPWRQPASAWLESMPPRFMPSSRPAPPALQEARALLRDTQAAFKLLMETVREKEGAVEALEGQAEGLQVGQGVWRAAARQPAALLACQPAQRRSGACL